MPRSFPDIKLIALDIDGTILNRNHEMSERTVQTIRRAREKDCRIVLCTGRRYPASVNIIESIGCIDEIIVSNGVVVKKCLNAKTVYSNYLPSDRYLKALEHTRQIGLPPVIILDEYPGKDIIVEPVDGANRYHKEFVELNSRYCSTVERLEDYVFKNLVQFAFFEEYPTLLTAERELKKYLDELVDCFTIRAIKYSGSSMEIVMKGSSKWTALEYILRRDDISPENVMAIGDDVNDIEMISNAGFGVAMANAFDEVKAVAKHITLDRDNDGAAETIERCLGL